MQDILVAIIISWVLFRLFRPVFFVQWGNENKRHTYSSQNTRPQQPEGHIHVTKDSPGNKTVSDSAGEYVDYEEIK